MKKIRTVFISTGQQEPRGRGKHKQEGGESIKMNKESVKELMKAKREFGMEYWRESKILNESR